MKPWVVYDRDERKRRLCARCATHEVMDQISPRTAWAYDIGACHPDADPDEWMEANAALGLGGDIFPSPVDIRLPIEIRGPITCEECGTIV